MKQISIYIYIYELKCIHIVSCTSKYIYSVILCLYIHTKINILPHENVFPFPPLPDVSSHHRPPAKKCPVWLSFGDLESPKPWPPVDTGGYSYNGYEQLDDWNHLCRAGPCRWSFPACKPATRSTAPLSSILAQDVSLRLIDSE